MNSQIKLKVTLLTLVTFLSFSTQIFSQSYKVSNSSSDLKVYGTSSLHDWHVDAEDVKGNIQIEVTEETLNINQIFGGILILMACILITFREIKSKKNKLSTSDSAI